MAAHKETTSARGPGSAGGDGRRFTVVLACADAARTRHVVDRIVAAPLPVADLIVAESMDRVDEALEGGVDILLLDMTMPGLDVDADLQRMRGLAPEATVFLVYERRHAVAVQAWMDGRPDDYVDVDQQHPYDLARAMDHALRRREQVTALLPEDAVREPRPPRHGPPSVWLKEVPGT